MIVTIRSLLEKRAKIIAEMRAIVDAAAPDGTISAEQQAAFDKLKAALVDLEATITNRAALEDFERRMMTSTALTGSGDRNLDRAVREFSLIRAIAGAAGMQGIDNGREREISAELARRSGRQFQGIAVPMTAFHIAVEKRTITSTGTVGAPGGGGSLIMTDLDGSQYIPALYAALTIRKMGARVLENLTSNVDIPRLADSAVSGWVAENSALAESDEGFDKISLRPHHAGTYVQLSRNMLMQSTPDIESLVRADLAQVLARTLDAAAIAGTGGIQPTGILNTPGIGSAAIEANGGPINWGAVLSLSEQVELGNVMDDSRAFLGNPKVKAQAMQTLKAPSAYGSQFIMDNPDKMGGYDYRQSNLVPSNGTKGTGTGLSTLIYGNWSDLILGLWSELDILVNPYADSVYTSGNVAVRAMMTCDIAVRHPQSFAALTDIAAP